MIRAPLYALAARVERIYSYGGTKPGLTAMRLAGGAAPMVARGRVDAPSVHSRSRPIYCSASRRGVRRVSVSRRGAIALEGSLMLPGTARGVLKMWALVGGFLAAQSAAAAHPSAPNAALTPIARDGVTERTVFVAGATGRTGRRVLEALLEVEEGDNEQSSAPRYSIVAGVRSKGTLSKSPALPRSVSQLVFDLASEDGFSKDDSSEGGVSAVSALSRELISRDVSDVICTVGFAPTFIPEKDRELAYAVDYLGTLRLIEAAEAADLRGRFVLVSSLGVNASTESARLLDASLGRVLRQKRAAEAALQASTLDWTIVRPGLLQKEVTQGGILLGPADRWTGDAVRDREGLGPPVKCASPFLASSGAVCAATRLQVAQVCVSALSGDAKVYSRRVVEVVARPDVPAKTVRVVGGSYQ